VSTAEIIKMICETAMENSNGTIENYMRDIGWKGTSRAWVNGLTGKVAPTKVVGVKTNKKVKDDSVIKVQIN
jgi:hypothetical protein